MKTKCTGEAFKWGLQVMLLVVSILLAACTERDSPIEEEEVVQTMNDFFTALSTADSTLLIRITKKNFTLYEHDEIWNRDSLLSLMPAVEGRIWKIRDPIIHVEGNMAHIYYYNVSQKPEGRS
ncbi:MAG: hypothetical protein R3211_05055, partial [Balneolaceae bacterium]|nr:hypothetical protein [Balneolaceae bacterium]